MACVHPYPMPFRPAVQVAPGTSVCRTPGLTPSFQSPMISSFLAGFLAPVEYTLIIFLLRKHTNFLRPYMSQSIFIWTLTNDSLAA